MPKVLHRITELTIYPYSCIQRFNYVTSYIPRNVIILYPINYISTRKYFACTVDRTWQLVFVFLFTLQKTILLQMNKKIPIKLHFNKDYSCTALGEISDKMKKLLILK